MSQARVKGIFVYKAFFGYTVNVDGNTLDLDVSYGEAVRLAKYIARLRTKGGQYDERGYARRKERAR